MGKVEESSAAHPFFSYEESEYQNESNYKITA